MIPVPYLGSICHKAFALALSPHRAFEMKSNQCLENLVTVLYFRSLHPASANDEHLLIRAAAKAARPHMPEVQIRLD
jgi:hypothetical protein